MPLKLKKHKSSAEKLAKHYNYIVSHPRPTSKVTTIALLALGVLTIISLSPLLIRDYTAPQFHLSFWALIMACCLYPTCLLAFIRKNIARKNGDWFIIYFVLISQFVLFWLASTQK